MKKIHPLFWFVVLMVIGIFIASILFDLSFVNTNRFFINVKIISTFFFGALPLFLVFILLVLLLTNRWAFKIERLSLGGFNLLFDNPAKLYKRSVRSFLDTKRKEEDGATKGSNKNCIR